VMMISSFFFMCFTSGISFSGGFWIYVAFFREEW